MIDRDLRETESSRAPRPASPGRRARRATQGTALVLALACGGGAASPEEQIRAVVRDAQSAANDRDAGALRDMIAESYEDERGLDKEAIGRVIALHLLRGRPYVLTRVQELEPTGDGTASLRVLAGLARVPTGGLEEMLRTSADVFVFDLEMRAGESGEWLVHSARWRRARVEDLSG